MSRVDRKYIEKLKELQEDSDDMEYAHKMADMVLCDLLTELTYTEVVDEWEKIKRWYS